MLSISGKNIDNQTIAAEAQSWILHVDAAIL